MKTKTRSTYAPSAKRTFTQEEISTRARALWEEKGRPSGVDTEIWLEAEKKLAADSPSSREEKPFADPKVPTSRDYQPTGAIERRLNQVKPAAQHSVTAL